MTSKVNRIFTGIAGLPVCKEPHKELIKIYSKCLRGLDKLPADSKYKQMTHKLITDRKQVVDTTPDRSEVERKIGDGLVEELIEKAKLELKCIETMNAYKPWEPLSEKPPQDQWKWPL